MTMRHCVHYQRFLDNGLRDNRRHHFTTATYTRLAHGAWTNVFSFAIVRCPYARHLSLFYMYAEQCRKFFFSPCSRTYHMPPREQLRGMRSNSTLALHLYAHWLKTLDSLSPPSSCSFSFWPHVGNCTTVDASQAAWLISEKPATTVSLVAKMDGPVPLDDVWANEIRSCLQTCGNLTLEHDNVYSWKRPSVAEHYASFPELSTIIEQRMARDFETFGYPHRPWVGAR